MSTTFRNIDEYIAGFPEDTQEKLERIRTVIRKAAPQATEIISYNMPAFALEGSLVYFAGYKHHIGFYPTSTPMKVFREEIAVYKNSKGAIQFPLDKPIPAGLVTRIVKFRVKENKERAALKKKKK